MGLQILSTRESRYLAPPLNRPDGRRLDLSEEVVANPRTMTSQQSEEVTFHRGRGAKIEFTRVVHPAHVKGKQEDNLFVHYPTTGFSWHRQGKMKETASDRYMKMILT